MFKGKIKIKTIVLRVSLLAILTFFAIGFITKDSPQTKAVAASPGDVMINEIMYNPNTGNQNDEFLELYNTTGSQIDISGWSFSNGITLTFGPSTYIEPNDYIVVSPDPTQTLTTYGVATLGSYAGSNLSNGGETVTLVDESLNVIDTVNYDDVSPWPTSPDGTGPSLELKGTGLDNSDATNWGASTSNGGTPLVVNSQVGLNLPVIDNVNDPNDVTNSQDVDIVATVTGPGISSVELKYKTNFDADTTVTMYDDGSHNDGAAADDVYGAQIPAQAEKTLVRFKVEAVNGSGTQSSPSIDDSMDYHGYYVRDPNVTANVPIFEWFISDSDYTDMHTNHIWDNFYLPSVIVLGNDVYDNSLVRIKGEITRNYPKKSYKFKLPAGNYIDMPGGSNRKISEFHMNSEYQSGSMGQTLSAWWVIEGTGIKTPDRIVTRVQKNGEYEGLYTYFEKYENEWRDEYGYNNGELFEDFGEIHSGTNSLSSIQDWSNNMALDDKDPVKRDYVLDNNDIPNMLNYMSAKTLLSSWDHYTATNTFSYKSNETGRWSHLYWDLSSAFNTDGNMAHFPSPYDHDDSAMYTTRVSEFSLYGQQDIREMYFRRLRTLADKFYSGDQLDAKFQEFEDQYQSEMALDIAKWPDQDGYNRTYANYQSGFKGVMREIKRHLLVLHRQPWGIPAAQTLQEREQVYFDEIVANTDNSGEYIKISSNANTAVDISNWVIEGVNYTIPEGSVIPKNGSIYLVRDDIGYRSSHPAVFIFGQYPNDLGNDGTLTLKTDTGVTIDTGNYSD